MSVITEELRQKFLALEAAVNEEVLERWDEARGLLLGTLSKKHIFQVGEPGTAKSYLIERFVKRIDGLGENGLFKWQLNAFTNDSEIFGPFALSELRKDRYKRILTHKLPLAYFAYLDEIFKASSAALNMLLKILNEREFDNSEAEPLKVPLISVMTASNELPTSQELAALADRFHLWYLVSPIRETSNLVKMLTMEVDPEPEKIISLEEIEQAHREIAQIEFPDDLFETVLELKEHLSTENIEISDRRLRQALEVTKAQAWLNGNDKVQVYDMKPLQFMFWKQVADIDKVRNVVLALTDPLEQEVLDTMKNYNHAFEAYHKVLLDSNDAHEKMEAAQECLTKWVAAKKEHEEFRKRERELGRVCRANNELIERLQTTIHMIVVDGMGVSISKVDELLNS